MQVSVETLTGLERRMTIGVPAEQIESQIQSRLQEAARNFSMKGFRKGKVPIKVIKSRYGKAVRQEVLGEVMSQSYYEAVNQENIRPAGQPKIEASTLEEGKDLEFTATFEVYPEIDLEDFEKVKVVKKVAEVSEENVDSMIETLRKQRQTWTEVDRASQEGDELNIDFEGTVDGEKFEGGEAKETNLVLGSKRMIAGFEDGLLGAKKGDEVSLDLSFPEDYHNKELAGKPVQFAVKVNAVSEPVLPELNKEFFKSFDVEKGGIKAFRKEVANNMKRELKNAGRNNIKTQIIDALMELHEVAMPKALVDNEINILRQQAMSQFGGGKNLDPSMLPAELFKAEAEKRVSVGLIMGEVIKQNTLKADPKKVRKLVEELAESYQNPEEVVNWYYANEEQLANVESMALEEAVIDLILGAAEVEEQETSYEEAVKPEPSRLKPADDSVAQDEDAEQAEKESE